MLDIKTEQKWPLVDAVARRIQSRVISMSAGRTVIHIHYSPSPFGIVPAYKHVLSKGLVPKNFVSESFSVLLTLKPKYGNMNANIFCGGCYHGTHSDHRDPQSVWEREEWRLRRMPDFLPVRMQDQLRYRQPEVRKQDRKGIQVIPEMSPEHGGIFSSYTYTRRDKYHDPSI